MVNLWPYKRRGNAMQPEPVCNLATSQLCPVE